jgi:hypothetical protein
MVIEIHVFIRVQDVSIISINEIVDRGVEPFLIRATDQQDAAILHGALPAGLAFGQTEFSRRHTSSLVISGDGFIPGFFADERAIFR